MKALKRTRAISLGAILLLVVWLWPTNPQRWPDTPTGTDALPRQTLNSGSQDRYADILPGPSGRDIRTTESAQRPMSGEDIYKSITGQQRPPNPFRVSLTGTTDAASLPPNPHAAPLWQDRVPRGKGQIERGLFVVPVFRDREH